MKNNRFLFFFLLVLVLLMGLVLTFKLFFKHKESYLIINNHKIFIEVADSPEEINRGLSSRESLAKNKGMLFIFPQPDNYSFWMKEMKFNLDFVFIHDQEVVDLVEDVPFPKVGEQPQIVRAKAEFDKVLEINQEMIKEINIKIGDRVTLFL